MTYRLISIIKGPILKRFALLNRLWNMEHRSSKLKELFECLLLVVGDSELKHQSGVTEKGNITKNSICTGQVQSIEGSTDSVQIRSWPRPDL